MWCAGGTPPSPEAADPFEVLLLDDKALKRVAKQLAPALGTPGQLLGGKLLVVPVRGKLATRGFVTRRTGRRERLTFFRWPIWEAARSVAAVRTALGLADVVDEAVPNERFDRSAIRAVLESERVTIGQGFGQLRPAVRIR